MRVSFFSVFRCFEARQGATLGISYATIQVGLTREAGYRSIDENRAVSTLKRVERTILSSLYALPFYDFDLRASHARTLLPAALASVPFGFVLVRVRVRFLLSTPMISVRQLRPSSGFDKRFSRRQL